MRKWQTNDPFQAAGIVLEDPNASDDAIALKAITSYDAEAQRRYMQGVAGPLTAELLKLHKTLGGEPGYFPVFQAACSRPTDLPKTIQDLHTKLGRGSMNWQDRRAAGTWML